MVLAEGGRGTFGSFFASVWWALVTMTTVGYGDMVPVTTTGRIIASIIIIVGVILVSMFTAAISSIFVAAKIREGKGLQQVKYRNHIILCGWCHITRQYLESLAGVLRRKSPQVVLVADIPGSVTEDLIPEFASLELKYVRGDWTQEAILKRAGVKSARTVVILPDETQSDPTNPRSRAGTELQFKIGGAARVVTAGSQTVARLFVADGAGGWQEQAADTIELAGPQTGGRVVELRIPYQALNQAAGDPVEIIVAAVEGGADIDLAPNLGSQVIFEDATNVVKVMFVVDVSGTSVPRDAYGSCCDNHPPPDGQGIVYIAGNLPALGAEGDQWVPNVVSLRDDGQSGDESASDQRWTIIVDAQRGDAVKYKYTIGLPSDEGRWFGTEEFPVTYRGIDVVGDDPGKKLVKIIVRDIFADKPTGGRDGYPGSMTTFEDFYEQ